MDQFPDLVVHDRRQLRLGQYEHTVLALQGGGALGAYQAGVYEGLHELGFAPE